MLEVPSARLSRLGVVGGRLQGASCPCIESELIPWPKNAAAGGVGPPLHAFVANNLADATATSRALLTDAVKAAARPQVGGEQNHAA